MKARLCFKGTKLISEGGKASYVKGPCITLLKSGAPRQPPTLLYLHAGLCSTSSILMEQGKTGIYAMELFHKPHHASSLSTPRKSPVHRSPA